MKIITIELTMDELKDAVELYLKREKGLELGKGKMTIPYESDKVIALQVEDF